MRKLVLTALAATLFVVPAAQAAPPPHLLFDLAGTGAAGYSGDGGPAGLAELNLPDGVAIDSNGQVAVADSVNNRIRFVSRDGFVSTGAGTGVAGLSGDDAAATAAQLNHPQDVAATPDGGPLIADTYNHRVRRVSPGGQITTVAGSRRGFGGDGGPAAAAGLDAGGVAANADGGFVIADTSNARVRRVGPDGHISTIAGTGTRGSGGVGGPATDAQLSFPADVEVAPDGRVLVADSGANRVRWIDPSETIRTLAGVGAGYDGDGRDARLVQLNDPRGVAVRPSGDVVVAEGDGQRLRLILAGLVPAPTGAPQPMPPPSTGTPRSRRLVAALAQQSLRIRRRARVRLAYVLTDDARVTVELRRRGRRVAGARQAGRAGRNQITLRRLRRPGRYALRLTATRSDGRVSVDRGRLTVVR